MAAVSATLTGTSTTLTVGLSGATGTVTYQWEASADVIFSSTTIVDTDATFDYSSYTTTTYIRPVVTYTPTGGSATVYDDIAVIKVYKVGSSTKIDITFGSDIESIGNNAFRNCTSLAKVVIGDSVTSIGQQAFSGCTSLANVVIGDSVTSIGDYAFYNCRSLATITVSPGNTTFFTDSRGILYQITDATNQKVTAVLCPPATTITNITMDTVTKNGTTEPVYTVTSIGLQAFSGYTSLANVVIGDSVTSIGEGAFSYCTSLANVVIGDSVTSIGFFAFFNCTSLANIYFLGAKPYIDDYNFQGKSGDTAYYRATYDTNGWGTTPTTISYLRHIPTINGITTTTITGSCDSTLTAVLVYISSDDGLTWTTSTITNSSSESWSLSYAFETGKTYKVSTIANYYNATPDYSIYCKTPDLQSPTLQITSDKSLIKSGETATLTFTFSETVTDFVTADITTSNGTLGTLSGSGKVYTAIFTPTANVEGTATISIAANKFSDAAGNPNTATSLSITVDTLAPNTPAVTGTASNTISGTAEAGSTLVATNTNNVPESVSVDNTGKWRLKVASIDSYVFRARDTAGNISNPTTFSSSSFSFRYSGSSTPYRFTAGSPIKSIGMSSAGRISGDTSTSFKIKSALPPGLSFSRRTGKITGTPLETSPATKYTITSVSTVYASRSAKITIEVL